MQKVLLAAHNSPVGCLQDNLSQCQDHRFPFLGCMLSIYTKQMAETHTEARNSRRGITLSLTLSEAAVGGAQLTKAQPVSTGKTFPPYFHRYHHTCNIEAFGISHLHHYCRISKQLLPKELHNYHTPEAAEKAKHNTHKGKWREKVP